MGHSVIKTGWPTNFEKNMTRYILTIAGEGSRWNNYKGVRKHLVPINNEPNLFRTIRLIKENDPNSKIYLACNFKFIPDGLDNSIEIFNGLNYVKGAESDRYINSSTYWNPEGRTVLIWGDVFFTKDGIKTICLPTNNWLRYGRPGRCTYSHRKHWGEEFAISFNPEHHQAIYDASKRVEEISLNSGIQLYGAIYLAMLGYSDNEIVKHSSSGKKPNLGHMIEIIDMTDDFDFPQDYDEFLKVYKGE